MTQQSGAERYATKIGNVLNYFVFSGSLNRFEASYQLYDTALNSTVSDLANGYGLDFEKCWEVVPNRAGGMTRVKRYSLSAVSIEKALRLLKRWQVGP